MGAFLSLLGGLSKGAGEAYGEIDKQRREQKAAQDKAVADAIYKEMTTNEQLLPEQQHHLLGEYLAKSGVTDKKVIKGIQDAYGYHRKALEDQEAQSKQAPELPAPQQTTPEGVQLPPTSALPSLPTPPYQAKTAGQLKFEESRGRVRQAEDDKAEAVREAARRAAEGSLEDKITLFRRYEGTSMEDEVRYMLNMAPRGGQGVASRNVPGQGTRGADLISALKQQGKSTEGVDPGKLYSVSIDRDGHTIVGWIAKEESAVGTGKEISGAQAKAMGLAQDKGGAAISDGGTYTVLHSQQGGGILGVIPTNQLQTYAQRNNVKVTTDADGNVIAVPVTESTITTKAPVGVAPSAAVLPPMPQAPGVAPATISGGVPAAGPGGARVIGQKPIEIPETKVEKINAAQDLIIQARTLQELLPKVKNYTGPVVSRVFTSPLYNYAGGLGLPDDVNRFLTNMRELVATKAFERGGKTLPMSEQRIYTAQLPKETDTPATLISKMSILLPLVQKDYENQLRGLTGNQRKKLTATQENVDLGGPLPTRPTPGAPKSKFKVGDVIQSGPYKGKRIKAIVNGEAELE